MPFFKKKPQPTFPVSADPNYVTTEELNNNKYYVPDGTTLVGGVGHTPPGVKKEAPGRDEDTLDSVSTTATGRSASPSDGSLSDSEEEKPKTKKKGKKKEEKKKQTRESHHSNRHSYNKDYRRSSDKYTREHRSRRRTSSKHPARITYSNILGKSGRRRSYSSSSDESEDFRRYRDSYNRYSRPSHDSRRFTDPLTGMCKVKVKPPPRYIMVGSVKYIREPKCEYLKRRGKPCYRQRDFAEKSTAKIPEKQSRTKREKVSSDEEDDDDSESESADDGSSMTATASR